MTETLLLDPENLKAALVKADVFESGDDITIEYLSTRYPRNRTSRRRVCRVWNQDRPVLQVYVGSKLGDLYSRGRDFFAACGEIAIEPQFYIPNVTPGRDIVGFKFYDGTSAEQALAEGKITGADLEHAINTIQKALAQTEQPSCRRQADRELQELFDSVSAVEDFTDIDIAFLREAVLPELRSTLIEPHPKTLWSNGDFIASNILLGSDGPKLVDYEFAHRTHFFNEDLFRLARYSSLPRYLRDSVLKPIASVENSIAIYAIMRQVVLEAQVKTVADFREELKPLVRELLPLVDPNGSRFRRSVFVAAGLGRMENSRPEHIAQIFFARGEDYRAGDSVSVPVVVGNGWQSYEFALPIDAGVWRLRFDPVDAPALVDVASIEITQLSSVEPVFRADGQQSLADLRVSGTAVRIHSATGFRIVSHGIDPHILLPEIEIPADRPTSVSVSMRIRPLLTAIPEVLSRFQETGSRLAMELATVAEAKERCERAEVALAENERIVRRERDENIILRQQLLSKDAEIQHSKALLEQQRGEQQSAQVAMMAVRRRFEVIAQERDGLQVEVIVQRSKTESTAAELDNARQQIAILKSQGNESAARLDQLSAQINHLVWESRELKNAIAASQRRVTELEQSLSWRLMAPVRGLGHLFGGRRGARD